MESSFRLLRTVQVAMLISIGLYAFIAQGYGPAPREVSLAFFYSMVGLAAFMVGPILLVRRFIIGPAEDTLAGDSENAAALTGWRFGYEAVALYGVALRFIGVGFRQVVPFFLAGLMLMLFLGPRRPSRGLG